MSEETGKMEMSSPKYREKIFKSDFEYFAHIRRRKGLFGFRREYSVKFPLECAYCGSPDIKMSVEIGKPELNLFRGVGQVFYCQEHAEPIKTYRLYKKMIMIPFSSSLGLIAVYGCIAAKNVRGFFYLVGIPVLIVALLIANFIIMRKGKNTTWNNVVDSISLNLMLNYVALLASFIVFTILMIITAPFLTDFSRIALNFLLVVLIYVLLRSYGNQLIKQGKQHQNIAGQVKKRAEKYTAVDCVFCDLNFYTLGFKRKDYYDEFCRLNGALIVGKDYRKLG